MWNWVGMVIWKCRRDKPVKRCMRFEVSTDVKHCGLTECAAVYFGRQVPK
jgi:hypothetical protein